MTGLFYYLIIINFFDAVVTWIGLRFELISEMNPLMAAVYELNPLLFFITKLTLSIILLLFILLKKVPGSSLVKSVAVFAAASYTAVFFMHGYWLVQVF
ncbi:DUF5658 family protein [Mesobacillus subterraneus]|uniref:DUF5658 family protein n=1 Tax=Mesobacillus subterraneus TaxID=285983 RepID=UPI001CFF36E0|nr:DUF5658 family protein [Mesobacillus subterraneus]WLR54366.1 DUF5658 family protein [Mesobacillus subterraneus]